MSPAFTGRPVAVRMVDRSAVTFHITRCRMPHAWAARRVSSFHDPRGGLNIVGRAPVISPMILLARQISKVCRVSGSKVMCAWE